MKIEWETECNIDQQLKTMLCSVADYASAAEKTDVPCCIFVRLCSDIQIREINREFRGIDASTDVLSFPTVRYIGKATAGASREKLLQEYDDDNDACNLGDIIISTEHAAAQAEEYGHSIERELAYLLTHGICHLMGYDHIEEDDKKKMRAMEEKILSAAGLQRENTQTSDIRDDELLALACKAKENSYSPYSGYPVGAALHCRSGRVFLGCNIENASFGLTNCAERTAVFKAVSEGERDFDKIAIAADASAPWPCGACRQVLNEFAPGIKVLVTWNNGEKDSAMLSELLPHGFGPESL